KALKWPTLFGRASLLKRLSCGFRRLRRGVPHVCVRCGVAENRGYVQNSVPLVQIVLMLFGLNDHFGIAIPGIEDFAFVTQSHLPLIASRPQRQQWELVRQDV